MKYIVSASLEEASYISRLVDYRLKEYLLSEGFKSSNSEIKGKNSGKDDISSSGIKLWSDPVLVEGNKYGVSHPSVRKNFDQSLIDILMSGITLPVEDLVEADEED